MRSGAGIFGILVVFALSITAAGAEDPPVESVEPEVFREAAERLIDTCGDDADRFCSDVKQGEGRVFACLHTHLDDLSESCKEQLKLWTVPDFTPRLKGTPRYATLEGRKLGEPNATRDGEPVVWDHPLPFLGQKVIDLGFELPLPFGVSVLPVWMKQDAVLEELAVSIDGGPMTEIDFIDFGRPEVETLTFQTKIDAWILPFLNVFVVAGSIDGEATIPLSIEGKDLFPELCEVAPSLPACVKTYTATAAPKYGGTTLSTGINLAMGWNRYFLAIPVTYTWSDIDIIDNTVETLHISPRIGVTADVGKDGMISAFIGATHLGVDAVITGSVTFDTPGAPDGETTTIDYRIRERNRDPWNYLLGVNWDITKRWSVVIEAGFGGSRENLITGFTYRF